MTFAPINTLQQKLEPSSTYEATYTIFSKKIDFKIQFTSDSLVNNSKGILQERFEKKNKMSVEHLKGVQMKICFIQIVDIVKVHNHT